MVKLIIGCGYLAMRVAQRWIAAGETVWATTRTERRAAEFHAGGLRPIVVDVTKPFSLTAEIPPIDTALFALGFDRSPNQSLVDVYVGGLANVLVALTRSPERFVFISSTGVYGQSGGVWVDENSECLPTSVGGQACLAAEQLLAASPFAKHRIVLRLAGIYGPGRIPKMSAVQHGEPIDSPEFGCLNLIHVDDAADVVLAVEQYVRPPQTIVVSDGQPVLRGDFYRELARILRAPMPQFVSQGDKTNNVDRTSSDKRVSNRRLREILPRELSFPSYREGLAAIAAATAD